MPASLIWTVFGVLAGSLVALQAPINAQLGRGVGSPLLAAAISFLAGLVALLLVNLLLVRDVSPGWRDTPIWMFVAGGCLGAMFVTAMTILTPRLGAATMMALVVAGQLVTGILVDHFGWFGLAVREVSVGRVAGAAFLIVGAVLLRFT